jgi:hypothetical protein
LKKELDVQEVFEPDEILWENLKGGDEKKVRNKLIMLVVSVITIATTTLLQVLIESNKTQFERENPPLLCPPKSIEIEKDLAY